MDQVIRALPELDPSCGSTAATCFVDTDNQVVHLANCGDPVTLLGSVAGKSSRSSSFIKRLSTVHHTSNTSEVVRIRQKGGLVFNKRVYGKLCLTRAFGHDELKEYVPSQPAVFQHEIQPEKSEFIVILSDGLTDVLTDEEICHVVNQRYHPASVFGEAAKRLIKLAKEKCSMDNLTVLITPLF